MGKVIGENWSNINGDSEAVSLMRTVRVCRRLTQVNLD